VIIGHSQLVRDFKELIKRNRLSHSYVFFGEPEVGKFYFAKHFAAFLETGKFELTKKPLQDSLLLKDAKGIDAMRELKSFLWQKPIISLYKLVVINDASSLTPQAQNAILKITEEPPESAVLILIVNQLENLIPPLRSRLQKIYFGRLTNDEMKGVAKVIPLIRANKGYNLDSEKMIAAAYGSQSSIYILVSSVNLFNVA